MARILILTSEFAPFRGGVGTYAHELAAAAAASGHAVVLVAPDYHGDQSALDASLPYRVVRFAGGPANFKGLPQRLRITLRMLRSEKFDIIHAADWPFFIPVRIARKPRGSRVLLTLHGTEIRFMESPKRRWLLDLLGFWKSGWASWIANSAFTRQLAIDTLPIKPDTIRAVPLGVSKSWIDSKPDRAAARERFGAEGRLVIVSLGRIVPRKGHLIIARALASLPTPLAERVDWWIIGPLLDARYAEEIREHLTELHGRGELLGLLPPDEVKARVAAADLFCLPGYAAADGTVEGFGLVFLEAAAYGVPTVATLSGGIPDAVENGVTGILVPEKDAAATHRAILDMLQDEPKRREMARAAEARAHRMTWPAVMDATYSV